MQKNTGRSYVLGGACVMWLLASACGTSSSTTDAGASDAGSDASVSVDAGAADTGTPPQDASVDAGEVINALEYTPPTGAATGSGVSSDGPGPRRILLATSTDGISFTRLDQLISDQTNTPNLVVLPSGRILLYYTAHAITGTFDNIAVAVSDDNAASWRYFKVAIDGVAPPPSVGDPDVVRLEDGSFRMYVTHGGPANTIVIKSATSSDGFNFTYEGIALNTSSQEYKDSLTQRIGDTWVQFVLHSSDGNMGRATSSDGVTFALQGTQGYMNGGELYVLSNWLAIPSGGFRVYGFRGLNAQSQIRSFTTTDGVEFTPDTTECLRFGTNPLERTFVKDAAVARMANGTYLMAYVSEVPSSM
jgi:hypothetical protein